MAYISRVIKELKESAAFNAEIYNVLRSPYSTRTEDGEISQIISMIDGKLIEDMNTFAPGYVPGSTTLRKLPMPYLPAIASKAQISSAFGPRLRKSGNNWHYGIDLVTSYKAGVTDVICVADGIVFGAGFGGKDSYVAVYHPVLPSTGQPGYTLYLHMDIAPGIAKASKTNQVPVRYGTVLGKESNHTYGTGTHLHFEVRNSAGVVMDPSEHLSLTREQLRQNALKRQAMDKSAAGLRGGVAEAYKSIYRDTNNYGMGKVNSGTSEVAPAAPPAAAAPPPEETGIVYIDDPYPPVKGKLKLKKLPLKYTTGVEILLDPDFADKVMKLCDAMTAEGRTFKVKSGYRDYPRQKDSYDKYLAGGQFAIDPTVSRHRTGKAVDFALGAGDNIKKVKSDAERDVIFLEEHNWISARAAGFGLFNNYDKSGPKRDLPHFSLDGL